MYPHVRLLLSAATFSASLGILVAVAAFILGFLEASGAFGPRAEDLPFHALALLAFFLAPALAILSLAITVPASYFVWKSRSIQFSHVAATVMAVVYLLVALALLPGSSLASIFVAGTILALAATTAAYFWALSMPRSNH